MRLSSSKSIQLTAAAVIGCVLGLWFSAGKLPREMIPQATAAERSSSQELDHLLKVRYDTAKALLDLEEKRLQEGVTTLGHVCEAARWVRDSAVELPVSSQERLAALKNYVALTRRLEASMDRVTAQGAAPPSDRESARYVRLDAEIMLLRMEENRQ